MLCLRKKSILPLGRNIFVLMLVNSTFFNSGRWTRVSITKVFCLSGDCTLILAVVVLMPFRNVQIRVKTEAIVTAISRVRILNVNFRSGFMA